MKNACWLNIYLVKNPACLKLIVNHSDYVLWNITFYASVYFYILIIANRLGSVHNQNLAYQD